MDIAPIFINALAKLLNGDDDAEDVKYGGLQISFWARPVPENQPFIPASEMSLNSSGQRVPFLPPC